MFEDDPLWYKDAIIYELHVKAFYDSNNDGIGDFRGLTEKLDYIQDLGVNTLWLLPFYPSPLRDDGYDIADYHGIHPDYGNMADFRNLVREVHRRGMRLITELVINHTSDQHPWFQAARKAPPGSKKRDYYVWSDTVKKYEETRIIFNDTETSNWTWDPEAKAYFWHRFFSHQPDLNFDNPNVVKAVMKTMRYWLDMGVDGMRLDAIPYLIEREGTNNENLPETHNVLKYMRSELDAHYTGRMFLAEANQWPEDVREYFGNGDECHMAYHFPLMPRIYMAVALEERHPIVEIMAQTPDIPPNCQWAIFLRNHDELTLEMVTDRERDYMYDIYAADKRMRINFGIRRRLAPLMENNRDKIQLVNSLLMSMPGSPILYYGDEIGMGDNVYLGDRNGVRTPMQWSPDRNAGFSRADPARLFLPPIMDPIYGFESVNVEAQSRNPSSLLNWTKRIIAVRKSYRAFGRGGLQFLHPGNRKILAYLREYEDETILCVANLSRNAQPVEIDLSRFKGTVPVELMGHTSFPPVGELPYFLTLPGYSFYWFHLAPEAVAPVWHEERLAPPELPVLVLLEGWRTFFEQLNAPDSVRQLLASRTRTQLEHDVLPAFLKAQRWLTLGSRTISGVTLQAISEWSPMNGNWLMTMARVDLHDDERESIFLPLALIWEETDNEERTRAVQSWAVARVRQRAKMGYLYDAFADELFCRALVLSMGQNTEYRMGTGTLRFSSTAAYPGVIGDSPLPPAQVPGYSRNKTFITFEEQLFLKVNRLLAEGMDGELEIGRFLTEVSPFPNTPPVLGALEYIREDGVPCTLALLQGYLTNQGSFWDYTLDYLGRFLEGVDTGPEVPAQSAEFHDSEHAAYLALVRTLALRTAAMHQALARPAGDSAFEPEPVRPEDVRAWTLLVRQQSMRALDHLQGLLGTLPGSLQPLAERVLSLREALLEGIDHCAASLHEGIRIRHHGDYGLEQVLLAQNDFYITNFAGAGSPLASARTLKHVPLRDVAAMLRSFDYAAREALNQACLRRPTDLEQFKPLTEQWKREAVETFLATYQEAVLDSPVQVRDPGQVLEWLRFFRFERTVHELDWALQYQPGKIAAAMGGMLRCVGQETEIPDLDAPDAHDQGGMK
ncbi:maltose alpha-D-glucosyltransferase [Thermithiobacillus plumbiphilus]|uniref:maltose alpha-D-glucosyltransferase n=1 Tax=Thermithiobacillus plumbiphilus TaxID=1729899 RepID=A0ABU9D9Y8_9PROT